MAKPKTDDASLKRLGGGRWQTRDERFTIEPQSGTWMVVDAEQTDDLGLPLVRGPFGSLTSAKEAITAAREAPPVVSPKAALVAQLRDRPVPISKTASPKPAARAPKAVVRRPPPPPPEPRWLRELGPADRRRARELIERLSKAGARDPEAIARRRRRRRGPRRCGLRHRPGHRASGPRPRRVTWRAGLSTVRTRRSASAGGWSMARAARSPWTLGAPARDGRPRGGRQSPRRGGIARPARPWWESRWRAAAR